MPLHPQAQMAMDLLLQFMPKPFDQMTVEEARTTRPVPVAAEVHEITDTLAGGVPVRVYRPSDERPLPAVVMFHGGGWVLGSVESHDNTCRLLTNRTGAVVVSVDYRLAPEHPFPAALEDCVAATRWAAGDEAAERFGIRTDRLALAGDSAGGNLAAVVAQLAPVPLRFAALVYPVCDVTMSSQSYVDNAEGYFLTRSGMQWFADHYLSGGAGSPTDPRVSPLLAPADLLAQSPPTLVVTAEYDPLRDEGEAYAGALRAAGVEATARRFDGMFHGFFGFVGLIDAASEAMDLVASSLRRALFSDG